jgi:hypothetical protein
MTGTLIGAMTHLSSAVVSRAKVAVVCGAEGPALELVGSNSATFTAPNLTARTVNGLRLAQFTTDNFVAGERGAQRRCLPVSFVVCHLNVHSAFAVIPPFRVFNNFAGFISGPVLKDETFFLDSCKGSREAPNVVATGNTAVPASRTADFSSTSTQIIDSLRNRPLPGNVRVPFGLNFKRRPTNFPKRRGRSQRRQPRSRVAFATPIERRSPGIKVTVTRISTGLLRTTETSTGGTYLSRDRPSPSSGYGWRRKGLARMYKNGIVLQASDSPRIEPGIPSRSHPHPLPLRGNHPPLSEPRDRQGRRRELGGLVL